MLRLELGVARGVRGKVKSQVEVGSQFLDKGQGWESGLGQGKGSGLGVWSWPWSGLGRR